MAEEKKSGINLFRAVCAAELTTLVSVFTVEACGRSSFCASLQKHVFTVGSFDTLFDSKVNHRRGFFPDNSSQDTSLCYQKEYQRWQAHFLG